MNNLRRQSHRGAPSPVGKPRVHRRNPPQIETESLCAEAATLRLFSIGTNDLTQYTPAVDRTNREVAHRADPFDPAVLRLIAETVTAAEAQGRWVEVCGAGGGIPLGGPRADRAGDHRTVGRHSLGSHHQGEGPLFEHG